MANFQLTMKCCEDLFQLMGGPIWGELYLKFYPIAEKLFYPSAELDVVSLVAFLPFLKLYRCRCVGISFYQKAKAETVSAWMSMYHHLELIADQIVRTDWMIHVKMERLTLMRDAMIEIQETVVHLMHEIRSRQQLLPMRSAVYSKSYEWKVLLDDFARIENLYEKSCIDFLEKNGCCAATHFQVKADFKFDFESKLKFQLDLISAARTAKSMSDRLFHQGYMILLGQTIKLDELRASIETTNNITFRIRLHQAAFYH